MSAVPAGPTTAAAATEAPRTGRLRRHRPGLLVSLCFVLAVLVTLLTTGSSGPEFSGALDPSNPDPSGARAVARVLEDRGVDVEIVRSAADLEDAGAGADATVVVTASSRLGRSTAERLLADTAGARVVVVAPGPGTTDALGLSAPPTRVTPDDAIAAGCDDATYAGLSLAVDDASAYPVADGCFDVPDGALLAEPRPDLVLLGAGEALSNDQVLRADNAAVALRLLGSRERLVWYVPSLDDLGAGDGVSASTLLPRWLRPSLWVVALAGLALLLWRGRRLGPLATEPLPVTVRAIETTRSRGRLYRKAGDRAHAAAVLRGAARARAADRLSGASPSDPDSLMRDISRHTGRPLAEVDALLGVQAPPPATDHDLITLAAQLAELDREVRRP